jgi:hypothetical protein
MCDKMAKSPDKFAELLTTAMRTIAARENRTIASVQDEIGYALGRETGGSSIEYWRKGHIPASPVDLEKLVKELVKREGLNRAECEQFLRSADYLYPKDIVGELFPPLDKEQSEPKRSPRELSPFVVGPPITTPRQFFGRARELKRIFGLWRRFPLQNVAVIGPKRSGKTSLLHYLKNITRVAVAELRPGQRTDWLPRPERYQWGFVDFQDARMGNRDRLLRYLLTSLNLPVPTRCNLDNFMDVVSDHLKTPAVILMDEIGTGLASSELDEPFWWSLRSLVSHYTRGNLAFLLTSHDSPAQLAQDQGKPSPFFNIFHTLELGPLTDKEARELIASSPKTFASADVKWILDQSGRWPCLLQILCHTRLTALEEGQTDDAWREDGLRQVAPFQHLLMSDK